MWFSFLIWFVIIFLYSCRIASRVLSPCSGGGGGGVPSEWVSPSMGSSGGGGGCDFSVFLGGFSGVVELLLLEPADWARARASWTTEN